jgi:hypothetical protein
MSHSGFDFDTAQAAAMRRLSTYINRAAGQHQRAMARQWAQPAEHAQQPVRVETHQPTAHGNTPGEMVWLNATDADYIKTHESPEFYGPSLLTMVRFALAFWLVLIVLILFWVY